jgi:trimeric autotransporter adhesin
MKTTVTILFLVLSTRLFAQVGINATNTAPNASAMLDVASSKKGALLPRMTTIQRNAIPTPAISLTVFDTDTKNYWFYDGTNWVSIASSTNFWSKFDEEDDIFNNNTGNVGICTSEL